MEALPGSSRMPVTALPGTTTSAAPWEEGESLILAWLGVAILAWAQLDAWAWRAPDGRTWVARNAVAPVLVMVAIPFLYPAALLSASKHPWRAFERHAGELRSATLVVSGSSTAHSVCWATDRRDIVIGGSPSEFDTPAKTSSITYPPDEWT